MKVQEIIKTRRLELGLTLKDVAKALGVSEGTVSRYESGDIQNMGIDKIASLADVLRCSPGYLMGWTDDPSMSNGKFQAEVYPVEIQKIPVLGKVACGQPIVINEEHEYYVKAGTKIKVDYALVAQGDSMINARIYDGDLVFLRKDQEIVDGDIYAVAIDDEITLKRVYRYPDQGIVQLVAENPKYRPMIFSEKDGKTLNIIGKAVFFQADVL